MKTIISLFTVMAAVVLYTNSSIAQNSILSAGQWYKLAVGQNGVYQITSEDLIGYGIDPTQIDPKNIQIFGNGNGMLSEANAGFRYDDLVENAIFVFGEDDGVFDQGDYILFYGEGPTEWSYNESSGHFEHQVNYYSDYSYYFLSVSSGVGKRIETLSPPSAEPTLTINTFNDYYAHELENLNLIRSGKSWYGEIFSEVVSYDYNLNLVDVLPYSTAYFKSSIANRSFENSTMDINVNNQALYNVSLLPVSPSSTKFAQKKTIDSTFILTNSLVLLNYTYNKPNDSAMAWLDYFELNYLRSLNLPGNQMNFRSTGSVGTGNISQFQITGSNLTTRVWEVTNPLNITEIETSLSGNVLSFKIATDSLLEFITFNGTSFLNPQFIGQIPNQNLHGSDPVDFIIITHPDFLMQAQQLAAFHETNDGLSVFVTTTEFIFNEFSSGAQDVSAIRDFIHYLYQKSGGEKPQYVLLFGDGSYDQKDRISGNTNFISTFQTNESLITTSSMAIEDYFANMDDSEGYDGNGDPDIGIGRLPVRNQDEALAVVNKIIHYQTGQETLGDWKNNICMIADDGDANLHLEQADSLSHYISDYNISKLYFDFYPLVQFPEGPRYPEAEIELANQVNNGNILLNYIGHGGNQGWGHERILETEDIYGWDNFDKLPVMIVATSENNRFDDPGIQSMGEVTMLKENGGAIAIISSTRLVYAQSTFVLNNRIMNFFRDSINPQKRLGDMIRLSKQPSLNAIYGTILIGDPALKMCLPGKKVLTKTINGNDVNFPLDSVQPGEQITVTGLITDFVGELQNNFNGDLFVKVFERPYLKTTHANQQYSYPVDVNLQDSILLELQTVVVNGEFEYSFTLASSMDPDYGNIKLSHYARDFFDDATGQFSGIVVGGNPIYIDEIDADLDFIKFYPTIAVDYLSFDLREDIQNLIIEVYKMNGEKLAVFKLADQLINKIGQLDVSELPSGNLIIHAIGDENQHSQKIIKK